MRMGMIIGGVFLVLLLSLGIGWLVFRRVLTPQIASANLPPSGARPWSRTRVPSPDSKGGIPVPDLNMEQFNMNAALAFNAANAGSMPANNSLEQLDAGYMQRNSGYLPVPNSFESMGNEYMQRNSGYLPVPSGFEQAMNNYMPQNNGFEPNMQGFNSVPNDFPPLIPGSFAPQGMQGYGYDAQQTGDFRALANGFASFSDSFVPPTPQIFQQNNAGLIPPGSGVLPVPENPVSGFAPASNAFNAMYGLSDDSFASSQPGAPNWLDNLTGGNNFSDPQSPPISDFITGEPDLNDPYLAELIRQYSQKSQAVQPQQQQPEQRPGNPNSQWLQ